MRWLFLNFMAENPETAGYILAGLLAGGILFFGALVLFVRKINH